MTFPLYIFLFAFLIFAMIIAIFFLINLHHLIAGGSLTVASILFTILLATLFAAVCIGAAALLYGTNWRLPLFSDGIRSVFQWGEKTY
jgi:hypothetical protein